MPAGSLIRGDQVPHFVVRGVDGDTVAYADIWQRRNLLLVSLPAEGEAEPYIRELTRRLAEFTSNDTACVIAGSELPGQPRPLVVVADRWGEVHFVSAPGSVAELPAPDELLEWLHYVQLECPECQGETK